MSIPLVLILIIIAYIGGVCITAIGPGGVFITMALFGVAHLEPATAAGTASLVFIGTGLLGSWVYLKSGELASPTAKSYSMILSGTGLLGAVLGSQLNTLLSPSQFGLFLGLFVASTGALVLFRRSGPSEQAVDQGFEAPTRKERFFLTFIGLFVGLMGGLLGVGGPIIAVPLLVLLGIPMLLSVALAQVQSIFIASFAVLGFAFHGAISLSWGLVISLPLFLGTYHGWFLAQRANPKYLKLALSFTLLFLGLSMTLTETPPS